MSSFLLDDGDIGGRWRFFTTELVCDAENDHGSEPDDPLFVEFWPIHELSPVGNETGVIANDLLKSCKYIKYGMQFVLSAFIWSHQETVPQHDILRGIVALRNSDELE
jgi:hypothetical protein